MERLRVDTDKLIHQSKEFESSATVFSQAGKEILGFVAGLPSYDGQLSTPARSASLEIHRQCQDLYEAYKSDSQSLARTAKVFEDVDNQSIEIFQQSQKLISYENIPIVLLDKKPFDVGTAYLGYHDDGLSDMVTLCIYGVCKKFARVGNEKIIEEFEKRVDAYEKARKERDDAFLNLCVLGAATAGVLLTTLTIGVAALFIASVPLTNEYSQWKKVNVAEDDMVAATNEAAVYWNLLTGDNLSGDNHQGVLTQHDCGDIY
jgi:uncharacterized protein YukE